MMWGLMNYGVIRMCTFSGQAACLIGPAFPNYLTMVHVAVQTSYRIVCYHSRYDHARAGLVERHGCMQGRRSEEWSDHLRFVGQIVPHAMIAGCRSMPATRSHRTHGKSRGTMDKLIIVLVPSVRLLQPSPDSCRSARYGGGELHQIASVVGGIASQEAVKVESSMNLQRIPTHGRPGQCTRDRISHG